MSDFYEGGGDGPDYYVLGAFGAAHRITGTINARLHITTTPGAMRYSDVAEARDEEREVKKRAMKIFQTRDVKRPEPMIFSHVPATSPPRRLEAWRHAWDALHKIAASQSARFSDA